MGRLWINEVRLVSMALGLLDQCKQPNLGSAGSRSTPSNVKWVPSPLDTIKVNCDAALTQEGEVIRYSLSMIARDFASQVLAAAVKTSSKCLNPQEAECQAAIFAATMARDLCFENIWLETDCLSTV